MKNENTRHCGPKNTTLAMIFKCIESTQQRRNWIKGFALLTLAVLSGEIKDGLQVEV